MQRHSAVLWVSAVMIQCGIAVSCDAAAQRGITVQRSIAVPHITAAKAPPLLRFCVPPARFPNTDPSLDH